MREVTERAFDQLRRKPESKNDIEALVHLYSEAKRAAQLDEEVADLKHNYQIRQREEEHLCTRIYELKNSISDLLDGDPKDSTEHQRVARFRLRETAEIETYHFALLYSHVIMQFYPVLAEYLHKRKISDKTIDGIADYLADLVNHQMSTYVEAVQKFSPPGDE